MDARTKQARVQKRKYPSGGFNSLGEMTLVNGVIILQETFKKYSLVSTNPRELLRATGEEA